MKLEVHNKTTHRHWNHRVLEFVKNTAFEKSTWRAIHIVYYDDEGCPVMYCEDQSTICSEVLTAAAIKEQLRFLEIALDKPVLRITDFPEHLSEYSSGGDAA